MPPLYQQRFAKAQEMMKKADIDILFVNNRENLLYFTGLTQIECLAVIIPREGEPCAVTLWLDAAYVQNNSGITTFGYLFPAQSLVDKCIEKMRDYGYAKPRIGFERYFVPFSVYDGLRQAFPESSFVNASELFYQIRAVKEPEEVEMMRQAAGFVSVGMAAAVKAVKPGVKENEVLAEAEYAMLKAGSDGSPFRPQVVSGSRTLLTHPCATGKRIQAGEIVVIHLGATCNGYCAKMCRTVAVGEIPAGQKETYKLLVRAQEAAIAALRPGNPAHEVDAAARAVIREAGLEKYYLDYSGYGIGLRQSEFYPIIGRGRTEIIKEGMVVDLLLPTLYRRDIGGPRVTDCIYVGKHSNEVLTAFSRELIQV